MSPRLLNMPLILVAWMTSGANTTPRTKTTPGLGTMPPKTSLKLAMSVSMCPIIVCPRPDFAKVMPCILSDHSEVSLNIDLPIQDWKESAYWHFNNSPLDGKTYKDILTQFWTDLQNLKKKTFFPMGVSQEVKKSNEACLSSTRKRSTIQSPVELSDILRCSFCASLASGG